MIVAIEEYTAVWWVTYSGYILIFLSLIFTSSFAINNFNTPAKLLLKLFDTSNIQDEKKNSYKIYSLNIFEKIFTILSNPALIAGILICIVVLYFTYWPQHAAPFDPQERGRILQNFDGEAQAAPFSPNKKYLMGSDAKARDMLSRVIHGTKKTMTICLIVTILRLGIGSLIGIYSGLKQNNLSKQMLSIASVSASIPSLLFALIFIKSVGGGNGIWVFIFGLGLTGWSEQTNLVNNSISWVKNQPYIESAISVGSSPLQIFYKHILPNISAQIIPATTQELSAVLLTLAELGFLGLYVGERASADILRMKTPEYPEWAGMLSGARLAIFKWPWLTIAPAIAITITIIGFNLTGIGLRKFFDPYQRYSLKNFQTK
ncbi:MAG: ABC transporter permease [SAR202 cluster bacterium]|nr:ABC transporter permease [SAR202 cluster bacterium]